jgi:uncharacterized membrane protein YecN with MAPEG domain
MSRIKNFFVEIGNDWKAIPRSVRFWNILLILSLIGLGLYNLDLLYIALGIGSILTIGMVMDGETDGETDNHIWILFMPITWCCIALVGIGAIFYGIYKITIEPFNRWLNKEKTDEGN